MGKSFGRPPAGCVPAMPEAPALSLENDEPKCIQHEQYDEYSQFNISRRFRTRRG